MTARADLSRLTVHELGGEFLVVCPRCGRRAAVRDRGADAGASRIALACPACGHSAVWRQRHAGVVATSADARRFIPGVVGVGAPVDWYFHLPLWLQAPCCGATLWAYDGRHLDLLERFVEARLRERRRDPEHGWRNGGLASRLPAWMQRAANRDAVLACIRRLRAERLGDDGG